MGGSLELNLFSSDFPDSPFVDQVSNNPPHINGPNATMMPTALIPFCAYKANLTIPGKKVDGFAFPFCRGFYPILLEGDLCYILNIKALLKVAIKTEMGKENGLMLLLDSGSLGLVNKDKPGIEDFTSLNMAQRQGEVGSIRIYINTMAPFSDHRAGSYKLSALKDMNGTKSFLDFPHWKKQCWSVGRKEQTLEHCQSQAYTETVLKESGCLPWRIGNTLTNKKVSSAFHMCVIWLSFLILLHFQDIQFCAPDKTECPTINATNPFGCIVPCLGLFADVTFKSDSPKDTADLNGEQDGLKLFKLIKDYKNFQDDYAKEIEFDIEQQ